MEIKEIQKELGLRIACVYKSIKETQVRINEDNEGLNLSIIDAIDLYYSKIVIGRSMEKEEVHNSMNTLKLLLPANDDLEADEGLNPQQIGYFIKCKFDKQASGVNEKIIPTICLNIVKANPDFDVDCSPLQIAPVEEVEVSGDFFGESNYSSVL